MNKVPCCGCEKRTITCHSTCEDYIAYSTALKERRAKENAERSKEKATNDFLFGSKENLRKKKFLRRRKGDIYED